MGGGEVPNDEASLKRQMEQGEKKETQETGDKRQEIKEEPAGVEKRVKEMQERMEQGLSKKRAEVTRIDSRAAALEQSVKTESAQSLAARDKANKQTDDIMKGVTTVLAPGAPMPDNVETRPQAVTQAEVRVTAEQKTKAVQGEKKTKEAAEKQTVQEAQKSQKA